MGLGYIGLPTAAALAGRGLRVTGVDTNPAIVEAVNRGEVPFVEPDLAVAVSGAVGIGKLTAQGVVPHADAYILAVPTPLTADKQPDLRYVWEAAAAVAPALRPSDIVLLESTVPPGSTRELSRRLKIARADLSFPHESVPDPDIRVAHCPERVLPGRIMIEIFTNDRVIGGVTRECAKQARAIYDLFCQGVIIETDAETAEFAKLAENTFRDVNIALANELASIAATLGVDIWEAIEIANRHPRVDILRPGPGVGGHCIAVDPWFLVSAAPDESKIIRSARAINDSRPASVASDIEEQAQGLSRPTIAVLGLAFKADVDDLRESPAVEVLDLLVRSVQGARLLVVEPHIDRLPERFNDQGDIHLESLERAIEAADIVALLVDHSAFASLPASLLQGKIVVDTRGLFRSSKSRQGE